MKDDESTCYKIIIKIIYKKHMKRAHVKKGTREEVKKFTLGKAG